MVSFLMISMLRLFHTFLCYKENIYKEMSPKSPKTFKKCLGNFQSEIPEMQFLKSLISPRAL